MQTQSISIRQTGELRRSLHLKKNDPKSANNIRNHKLVAQKLWHGRRLCLECSDPDNPPAVTSSAHLYVRGCITYSPVLQGQLCTSSEINATWLSVAHRPQPRKVLHWTTTPSSLIPASTNAATNNTAAASTAAVRAPTWLPGQKYWMVAAALVLCTQGLFLHCAALFRLSMLLS